VSSGFGIRVASSLPARLTELTLTTYIHQEDPREKLVIIGDTSQPVCYYLEVSSILSNLVHSTEQDFLQTSTTSEGRSPSRTIVGIFSPPSAPYYLLDIDAQISVPLVQLPGSTEIARLEWGPANSINHGLCTIEGVRHKVPMSVASLITILEYPS
jgi:hypothetical protein